MIRFLYLEDIYAPSVAGWGQQGYICFPEERLIYDALFMLLCSHSPVHLGLYLFTSTDRTHQQMHTEKGNHQDEAVT